MLQALEGVNRVSVKLPGRWRQECHAKNADQWEENHAVPLVDCCRSVRGRRRCSPPVRRSPRSRAARCACIIWDNPPSASIHEEATVSTVTPFMSIFNNLVLYDQHEKLNTMDNIRPELATSWSWNDDKTKLTFKLREDVKWHDGKPFTAKDVVCTLDKLQDKSHRQFRKNPRKIWWHNLKEVTANGDHEVTFQLGRPQASFLALFATGYNPVYPCHVSAADMRTKPIGTGPFKFVEFKSNEFGQARAQPRLLAARGSPTSTASTGASSPTARRGRWPSSPANST